MVLSDHLDLFSTVTDDQLPYMARKTLNIDIHVYLRCIVLLVHIFDILYPLITLCIINLAATKMPCTWEYMEVDQEGRK